MTELTEGRFAGECIVSEASGTRSREHVTILSGQDLPANAVLGKVTASGKYVAYDNAASDGSETVAGILYDAVDASDGDVGGVALIRDAEVKASGLDWNTQNQAGIDAGIVDLLSLGVVVRVAY